jgi:hypothetical protein
MICFKTIENSPSEQTAFFYVGIVKSYFTLKGCFPLNKSQKSMKSLAKL